MTYNITFSQLVNYLDIKDLIVDFNIDHSLIDSHIDEIDYINHHKLDVLTGDNNYNHKNKNLDQKFISELGFCNIAVVSKILINKLDDPSYLLADGQIDHKKLDRSDIYQLLNKYQVWMVSDQINQRIKAYLHDHNRSYLIVKHLKKAWCHGMDFFYHNPCLDLKIIAVTGTNGKSSTVMIINQILCKMNIGHIAFGTFGCRFYQKNHNNLVNLDLNQKDRMLNNLSKLSKNKGGVRLNKINKINKNQSYKDISSHTTQDPDVFFSVVNYLKKTYQDNNSDSGNNRNNKVFSYIVMEMSSHALDQDKLISLKFDQILFCSFSQDHLDYHHTMENYLASKLKIFLFPYTSLSTQLFVTNSVKKSIDHWLNNINDKQNNKKHLKKLNNISEDLSIKSEIKSRLSTAINIDSLVDLSSINHRYFTVKPANKKTHITFKELNEKKIKLPLITKTMNLNFINAYVMMCFLSGDDINDDIDIELSDNRRYNFGDLIIPGRMEQVYANNNFFVVVDYAHTPNALDLALIDLAQWYGSYQVEVWVVFGCGGDRDQNKRQQMGKVARDKSHRVFVTQDNCRSESDQSIIDQIIQPIQIDDYRDQKNPQIKIIENRKQAIKHAFIEAYNYAQDKINHKNIVLLIAGKGDEKYIDLGKHRPKIIHHDKSYVLELAKTII